MYLLSHQFIWRPGGALNSQTSPKLHLPGEELRCSESHWSQCGVALAAKGFFFSNEKDVCFFWAESMDDNHNGCMQETWLAKCGRVICDVFSSVLKEWGAVGIGVSSFWRCGSALDVPGSQTVFITLSTMNLALQETKGSHVLLEPWGIVLCATRKDWCWAQSLWNNAAWKISCKSNYMKMSRWEKEMGKSCCSSMRVYIEQVWFSLPAVQQ